MFDPYLGLFFLISADHHRGTHELFASIQVIDMCKLQPLSKWLVLIQYHLFYKILEVGCEGGMLYIYEVMKLVGYLIMKHVIKKLKEYSTT